MSSRAIQFYSTFLAILALVSLIAATVLIVYRIARGAHSSRVLGPSALWVAWLVALVATVGSLVYSEVIHFVPCRLCWFQRIAMYPMAVILLVGAIRREAIVRLYALPLALGGLALSTWHYLLQAFPGLEAGSACDPTVPCSARYVEIFGFISIPFMAGAGFLLIAVLLLLYTKAIEQ